MPVLCQHDVIEALGKTIDDRDHGIAVANRQRTAAAEIILHVDDQQHIVIAHLHVEPAPESISQNSSAKQTSWQQGIRGGSALREGLLDHELTGLAVIALDEALIEQQHARIMDQRGTAADHDAIML
jgi:hypothetical protein